MVVEAELSISQFGFEPIRISITGSGQYAEAANQRKAKEMAQLKKAEEEKEARKKKHAFRLRSTKGRNKSQVIGTTEHREELNTSLKAEPHELEEGIEEEVRKRPQSQGPPKKGKIELERAFLERYDSIVKLCKDKEIKMFSCLGDPQPTQEDNQKIIDEREEFTRDTLNSIRSDGISRYDKVLDADLPVLEPILPSYPPTWDMGKNNATKLRKMRLMKFMGAATKIVLRARVETRLNKIRRFLGKAATTEDVIRLVNEDWQKAELLGVGKKNYVKFDFNFSDASLNSHLLAVQYENMIDQSSETSNANLTIGFDDLAQINDLKYNDAEVLEYKAMDPFAVHLYPPIKSAEAYRTGAEEEYPSRGRIGPIGEMRKNPADMVIYRRIPAKLLLPPLLASYKIIYPRENMRKLEELASVTEADPEYMLRSESIDYMVMLQPSIKSKDDTSYFLHELIESTPGYDGLKYLSKLQIEKTRYWEHQVTLSPDIFSERCIEAHCPDIIHPDHIDKDDVKSDEESDDDNEDEFKLLTSTQEEFNVEKLDAKFNEKVKEAEEKERDEEEVLMESLVKMFEKEKIKNLSLMPTMTSDYNKYIKNAANKLFIM